MVVPQFHRAALEIRDVRAEVIGKGLMYYFDLLAQPERRATASGRSHLEMLDGQVLQVNCVRYADGKPFALEHRLKNLEQVPDARSVHSASVRLDPACRRTFLGAMRATRFRQSMSTPRSLSRLR